MRMFVIRSKFWYTVNQMKKINVMINSVKMVPVEYTWIVVYGSVEQKLVPMKQRRTLVYGLVVQKLVLVEQNLMLVYRSIS